MILLLIPLTISLILFGLVCYQTGWLVCHRRFSARIVALEASVKARTDPNHNL
jgi:hypothetical protein